MTEEYNYIGVLADFTLSASSTIEIDDELRYFLESETTWLSLAKKPTDSRLAFWKDQRRDHEKRVIESVSKRQIRDPQRVEPFDPFR